MADEQDLNTPAPEQPQYTAIEQRAMEQGWVPQDEWAGDEADWRPAKEFVDRGELLKSIQELKRENRSIREGVQEFKKHHELMKVAAYKQALADLKAKKREALEEGNADAVIEIDDKILETREAQRAAVDTPAEPTPQPQGPDPKFVRWEARNSWYRQDRAMKAVADEVARDMVGRGENDVERVLAEVDKEVRKAFPAKFENPNRSKPGAVENASKGGRTTSKDDVVMTDAEKAIMNKILKTGALTKEEYLKEYKARQAG